MRIYKTIYKSPLFKRLYPLKSNISEHPDFEVCKACSLPQRYTPPIRDLQSYRKDTVKNFKLLEEISANSWEKDALLNLECEKAYHYLCRKDFGGLAQVRDKLALNFHDTKIPSYVSLISDMGEGLLTLSEAHIRYLDLQSPLKDTLHSPPHEIQQEEAILNGVTLGLLGKINSAHQILSELIHPSTKQLGIGTAFQQILVSGNVNLLDNGLEVLRKFGMGESPFAQYCRGMFLSLFGFHNDAKEIFLNLVEGQEEGFLKTLAQSQIQNCQISASEKKHGNLLEFCRKFQIDRQLFLFYYQFNMIEQLVEFSPHIAQSYDMGKDFSLLVIKGQLEYELLKDHDSACRSLEAASFLSPGMIVPLSIRMKGIRAEKQLLR